MFEEVRDNHTHRIRLAFSKSVSDYDFTTGHYSPGLARYIAPELERNHLHVAVLGCYIDPVNPIEARWKVEVAHLIEHLKYVRILGADMAGTETECLGPDFNVIGETYIEDVYRLLLKSTKEVVSTTEKLGAIVGVEGVFNHTLHSPARVKRFPEDIDSPNVEVILDAANLIHPDQVRPEQQKQVTDRIFPYYDDRISVLHAKDFVSGGGDQLFRHVGKGLSCYPLLMERMKEMKPHTTMLPENSSRERFWKDAESLQRIYDNI